MERSSQDQQLTEEPGLEWNLLEKNKLHSPKPPSRRTDVAKAWGLGLVGVLMVIFLIFLGVKFTDSLLGTRASEMVVCGKWIFAQAPDDEGSLYRFKTEPTSHENPRTHRQESDPDNATKLNNINSYDIQVDGDWVYYRTEDRDNSLSRVKTDGSWREIISHEQIGCMAVNNGWIYCSYAVFKAKDMEPYTFVRIRADGREVQKLNDDLPANIVAADDWIYYSNSKDNGSIYRIKPDGSGRAKLNDEYSYTLVLCGDWIYYGSRAKDADVNDMRLCRLRTDGSAREVISEESPSPGSSRSMDILGGWVYFSNWEKDDCLYRVRNDGSGLQQLNEERSDYINVVGYQVYYIGYGFWGSRIHRINEDGSGQVARNFLM